MQENIYYKGGDKKSLGVSSPLKKKKKILHSWNISVDWVFIEPHSQPYS